MAKAKAPLELKTPPRSTRRKRLSPQTVLILTILLSLTFVILDQARVPAVRQARMAALEALSPALEVLVAPVYFVRDAWANLEHLAELRSENEMLRREVTSYEEKEKQLVTLQSENKELKNLLNFVPEESFGFISAPVIVDGVGLFARSILVKAGRDQGVRKGQAVMTGNGLIGRIEQVGPSVSRVILLNDFNSRVPVMFLKSRQRAVLVGNNSGLPRLEYLQKSAVIDPGDVIVTSGDGGAFPQGLPVGTVQTVREDRPPDVKLFSATQNLDFVRVVDYGLTGILSDFYKE